jgi:hydroxymethylbilane synthase
MVEVSMPEPVQVATRKSPLALRQTELVLAWLREKLPDEAFAALKLSTKVDERLNWSLEQRGGIGLFTKELEEALLEGRATLAVHSAKDLPTTFREGLHIAGYLPRANAADVLVHREDRPTPRTIASSSPRRRAQVGLLFPEAEWTTIRGNVGTRLKKIAEGQADASLLAAAGLERLGVDSHEGLALAELPIAKCVPAPGQAAIAIQCREGELETYRDLFCPQTKLAVTLERAFLRRLGGGCQTPVGAHFSGGRLHVFHPGTGHLAIELAIGSTDDIEAALDGVFAAHNFEGQ